MAVLGLIAMWMLPLQIPVMIKFMLLAILTFAVSNALVYIYQRLIQHVRIRKLSTASFILLLFISIQQCTHDKASATVKASSEIGNQIKPAAPQTGLHIAVIKNDLETIRKHIAAGSNLDVMEPSGGASPLITAATFGNYDAVDLLIKNGADINFRNKEGSTALITAAFFCRPDIVELLLDQGADKTLKNHAGSTALDAVKAPYNSVTGIYDYYSKILGPLGLKLDSSYIVKTRPEIANMLK